MRERRLTVAAAVAAVVGLLAFVLLAEADTSYTYTFDGAPGAPQSMYWMDDFDVQVHTRDMTNDSVQSMQAHHGPNCEAPGVTGTVTHTTDTVYESVFQCANHVMTALRADDYGLIYLTPNRMLDWSDGEATLSIDVSTYRSSNRDWIDFWLTPWDDQMAVPFLDVNPDLNGPPDDFLSITGELAEPSFRWFTDNASGPPGWALPWYENSSAMQRDTYVLTVRASTFDFCKPDEGICFAENAPHGLNATQAVFTFGHHSYTPTKPQGFSPQIPNTWHWDNLSMSDSVPFHLERANERIFVSSGTVTWDTPAPANSYLRFSGIGTVNINGQVRSPQDSIPKEEHFSSYFVPIPEGATSATYTGAGGWYGPSVIKDLSVVSLSTGTTPPTATSTPTTVPATPTAPPAPTDTPTSTSVATATATTTPSPEPTATGTFTPTAAPTSTPTSTPSSGVPYEGEFCIGGDQLTWRGFWFVPDNERRYEGTYDAAGNCVR